MPDSLLDRASRVAGRVSPYALVPAALSLLAFEKVVRAANAGSASFSLKFALPADVATLWTFVDPPSTGVTFVQPAPLVLLPVFLVAEAALTAGYLGGVRDAARGDSPDFVAAASAHWLSVLGVRVVQFVLLFALAFTLVAAGVVGLLLGIPLVLFVGYALWGASYLVVLRDRDAFAAIDESVALALDGGRYLTFSVAYAVVGSVASLLLSPFVTGMGLVGVLAGAAAVAYPSLVGTAAATLVLDDFAPGPSRGA